MISDANSIDTGTSLDCDICIVGAGAAGIAISLQFLRSNLRVILLESGTTVPDAATQQLYTAEMSIIACIRQESGTGRAVRRLHDNLGRSLRAVRSVRLHSTPIGNRAVLAD